MYPAQSLDQQRMPPWSWHPSPGHDGWLCDVVQDIISLFYFGCLGRVMPCTSCPLLCSVSLTSSIITPARHKRRLSGGLVRHPRHHQVVERRRCAGTGPLQHDFIGTVMLPNSDAGLRWVLSPVLARHIATYCVSFVTFLHEYEAITTPSRGRAALRVENGRSPRKAPPRKRSIESFYVFHERDGAARPSLQVLVSQAGLQDTIIFTVCSAGDGSVSLGGTAAAAAPGFLRADIVAGGQAGC